MDRLFETGYPTVTAIEAAAIQRLKGGSGQDSSGAATIHPNGVEQAGQPQERNPQEGSGLRRSYTFLLHGPKTASTTNR